MDWILTALLVMLALVVVAIWLLLRPMMTGAIYVPTGAETVERMLRMAEAKSGERAVDLGSGDGRIVIALAKQGLEAHGYEINPLLVWRSRRAIKDEGLEGKAFIHRRSLWKADLATFDVVTVYGIPYIMGFLGRKLRRDLKPGARVVSNIFVFPGWPPKAEEQKTYLYVA